MKLKITDVRQVIREIINEAMLNFERTYKFPTAEEQIKIQREFGMKIIFDDCLKYPHGDDIDNWTRKEFQDTSNPLAYFIVGLNSKNIYSTLDDGYSLLVASMNYRNPFNRPQEYRAVVYGPEELMKQVELSLKPDMYVTFDTGAMTAFTNRYISGVGFYDNVGELFYKKLLRHAKEQNVKIILGPRNTPKRMTVTFYKYEDIDRIANIALFELRKIVAAEFKTISVRLDFHKSSGGLEANFFNKYTGMSLGKIKFYNVDVKYYTGPIKTDDPDKEWDDQGLANYGEEPF